jgi:hypothetical protein
MNNINSGECDPVQFFKSLKNQSEKIQLPKNVEALIRETDELAINESLGQILSKNYRTSFVVFSFILHSLYKKQVSETRKRSLLKAKNNEESMKTKDNSSSGKLQREDVLTNDILRCKSFVAMGSVAIFCLNVCRESVKRAVLLQALNGDFTSMKDVLKTVDSIKNGKKSFNGNYPENIDIENQQRIIQALMELSEIVKDKSYSRLASTINEGIYMKVVQHYSDNNRFKTMFPVEPLMAKYLKDYVAQMYMQKEKESLQNQYNVDPKRTTMFLLDKMSKENVTTNNAHRNRKTKSASKYDNDKIYEVFKGPVNYRNHLVITNYKYNNRQYRIITYNDCLFDVIGYVSDNDEHTVKELYNNIPWSKRLDLLPYRAKIDLEEMTGEQLNDFHGYASLTVSWMEDGLEYAETFDVKSKK